MKTTSALALLCFLIPVLASAQRWPEAIATVKDFGWATDQFPDPPAILTASIGPTDLSIPVSIGSAFEQYNIITIDKGANAEKILICGVAPSVLTVCAGGRGIGALGSGVSHVTNAPVAARVTSSNWNPLVAEVISLEANFAAQVQRYSASQGAQFYQTVEYNTTTPVLAQRGILNFVEGPNSAIQVQDNPSNNSTDIFISSLCSPGTGGTNYQTIDVDGVATTTAPTLNFHSANSNLTIAAAYNSVASRTDVTFTVGNQAGGTNNYQTVQVNGVNQTPAPVVNFQGNGVTGSTANGVTTVNIAQGTASSGTVTSSPNQPDPAQCHTGAVGSFWQVTGAPPSLYACNQTGSAFAWTPITVHPIGMFFDDGGPVLSVGETKYFTPGVACTIKGWKGTAIGGSATINVWKLSNAYPTSSNSITASATPVISGSAPVASNTLPGWTTAVADTDTFAFRLNAVSGATQASLVLQCQ